MSTIFNIAKAETRRLFYSPIAWLVLTIFLAQLAYGFTQGLDKVLEYSTLRAEAFRQNYTGRVFIGRSHSGVFTMIRNNLFLYIPLLSMGLISREMSTGSFKLLASSPNRAYKVVLGKYLSMLFFGLLLATIVLCLAVFSVTIIKDFQLVIIIPGLLATFLLVAVYSAIGLYVSSLTDYPLVAAIGTFGVLALLNFVHNLGQEIPVLSELLYWFSIANRSKQMMSGLVSSSSVAYFCLVCLIFVSLTILRVSQKQKKAPLIWFAVKHLAVFILAAILIYTSSRPRNTVYKDFTPMKTKTISPQSQSIAHQFANEAVILKTYVNVLSAMAPTSGLPRQHNADFRAFEEWVRFIPQLDIEYIYFYDSMHGSNSVFRDNPGLTLKEIAKKYSASYNINFDKVHAPKEINAMVDLSGENNEYTRQIISKDKKAWLRMYADLTHYPIESNMASAFNAILLDEPKIGIVQGHGERSLSLDDGDYGTQLNSKSGYRFSAANFGFKVEQVLLRDSMTLNGVDILLIADPKEPYGEDALKNLDRLLAEGKNMLFLAEPDRHEVMRPILSRVGITLDSVALYDNSHDYASRIVFALPTGEAVHLSKDDSYREAISTYSFMPVVLSSATSMSVDPSGFASFPFLEVKSDGQADVGGKIVAVALSRSIQSGQQQRIAVVGDADFLSNAALRQRLKTRTDNQNKLVVPLLRWLSHDHFPVYQSKTELKKPADHSIFLNKQGIDRLRFLLLILAPFFIILSGAAFLYLRHTK